MNDHAFEDSDAEQQIESHAITLENTGEDPMIGLVAAERLLRPDEPARRDSRDDREMRLPDLMDPAPARRGSAE